ncbi:MAG: hypothetical protein P8L37_07300 [Phycisphaerales bacterium]|nr:hypothetical protein [Phycisphaerales bacterium]
MTDNLSMSAPETGKVRDLDQPPVKRTSWPTVIGILGIIFGSLGVLSSLCGFFVGIFLKSMLASLSGEMSPEEMAQITAAIPDGAYVVVASATGVLLAILLLVGSISLVKRRASCRMMLNAYVALGVVWMVASFTWNITVVYPEMQQRQAELVEQSQQSAKEGASQKDDANASTSADSAPASSGEAPAPIDPFNSQIHPAVSEGCGSIFGIAWFVILLIFMNGGRYRTEIESWRD